MRPLAILVALLATTTVAHADDAIAFGEGGLRLGATVVYAKPVSHAAYDAELDLVWFVSKGTLQVLDLRAAKLKPVVIAKKFPDVAFQIDGWSHAEDVGYDDVYAYVSLGKKSKISVRAGVYEVVGFPETDGKKKKIKKAKISGASWVKKLAKRTKRTTDLPPPAATTMPAVKPPAEMCTGEFEYDPSGCGEMTAFGNTGLGLAVVSYSCGDACYQECALYDPKTKLWADPINPTSSWGKKADPDTGGCWDYHFDRDGKSYYLGTVHCTIGDKGITCTEDEAWHYVGVAPPLAP
jgi:hypothetical protein